MSNNPLKQYFRQPAIYLSLPSKGQHYPEGTLDMPANGELPVYPMTAIDEITYRTPDALFNGQAVVNVIQSCIPNIRNAWAIPSTDIDAVLIAIRIASYGHDLEVETACPACNHTSNYGLDLRVVLDQMRAPDYSQSVTHGDIEIFFKPMSYKNLNDNNALQFEEQKLLQLIPDDNVVDEKKIHALTEALKKITTITVQALSQSISAIKTPAALVVEPEYIQEMLENCDRSLFNRIRDHIVKIKEDSELKPLTITCTNCNYDYQQALTMDMTSFFAGAY